MTEEKIAIVTGASSGFGKLIADRLVDEGYRVIGTRRKLEESETPGRVETRELELTSDDSVAALVSGVIDSYGRIDLLVNNAGRSMLSLVEETPEEVARRVLEINFWGPVRMNRSVLPIMRSQKGGLIVHVSSLAGLVGVPGQGYYAAAKHALEGYLETLRAELGPLPIEVSLVEPGFYKTSLESSMIRESSPESDYDPTRSAVESANGKGFSDGGDPEEVATAVIDSVRDGGKVFRRVVGSEAKKIHRLKRWLPQGAFLGGLRKSFGLG